MGKKQTVASKPVASAVQSAVAATPAAPVSSAAAIVAPTITLPPVNVLVIDSKWREWGSADAQDEMGSAMRLALYADALKGADYAKWEAFAREYDSGAAAAGYLHPDQLRSRRVTLALKGMGIEKPISPTSTNARAKTPEQEAKIAADKAVADKLAAMTEAECDAEIKSGKADPARLAKLWTRKVAANKATTKAVEKTKREENAKLYNACADILKTMEKSELQAAHRALGAIIAKRK